MIEQIPNSENMTADEILSWLTLQPLTGVLRQSLAARLTLLHRTQTSLL